MPVNFFAKGTRSTPLYVGASEVLAPDGQINEEVFNELNGVSMRYWLETDLNCCVDPRISWEERSPLVGSDLTIEDKIAQSDFAVLGTVTGTSHGFMQGAPGTLFRVLADEAFKGYAGEIFFFVPVGRFAVGAVEFCKTNDRYARLPRVYERVFLAYRHSRLDYGGLSFSVVETGVFPVSDDGVVSLPSPYTVGRPTQADSMDLDDFLRRVRAASYGEVRGRQEDR